MSKNRLDMKLLWCAAAFGALSFAGCADGAGTADDALENDTLEARGTATLLATGPQAVPSDGGIVPNPNGTYFVSVNPNGTGCPPGSTNTSISADGLVFTTTFSSYEVNINSQTPDLTVTKNCTLQIKLHSPNGISYAVTSFYYSGYSFLEQGVTASQWASYYFQGNPVPRNQTSSNRTNLVGPYDSDFLFKDDVKTADVVWSPCGVDRDLNINTTLQLRNGSPKRSGYANLSALDGSSKIEFKLAFTGCGGPTPPPILPDAGIVRDGN